MRTFIAIDFPSGIQQAIAQVQQQAQGFLRAHDAPNCLRWTPPQNIHLTLFFLGDTSPAQSALIQAGLADIGARHMPFELTLAGLGCFRNFKQPRVVWLGVDGMLDELRALQAQATTVAEQAGFIAEKRAYSPHITIARAQRKAGRDELRAVGGLLRAFADEVVQSPTPIATFAVDHMIHMESKQQSGGAVYAPLAQIRLGEEP